MWANPHINYNQPYGLLYFPKIFGGAYDKPNYKGKKWFGVRVSSPDDWDLDFDIDLPSLYSKDKAEKQYNYLIQIVKNNVITGPAEPEELFAEIKREFNAADNDIAYLHYIQQENIRKSDDLA